MVIATGIELRSLWEQAYIHACIYTYYTFIANYNAQKVGTTDSNMYVASFG